MSGPHPPIQDQQCLSTEANQKWGAGYWNKQTCNWIKGSKSKGQCNTTKDRKEGVVLFN